MRFVLYSPVASVLLLACIALGDDKPGDGKQPAPGNAAMDAMGKPAKSFDAKPAKAAQKLIEVVRPSREIEPVAEAIDHWVDGALTKSAIPASPPASDAEFLRRASLDIIGRIPTAEEAAEFLGSTDPQKRAKYIDALLASPGYGWHFATIWRELIQPHDNAMKGGRDDFTPWLADQFNANRGWNQIATDMLTVDGKIRELPQAGFIVANSESFEPQPNMLADATGRLFWGVQLRCAECHDHPFAHWKQTDFWSTAAFFSKLRKGYSDGKNPNGWTLTESPADDPVSQQFSKTWEAPGVAGPAILVSTSAGKSAGKVVTARFLGGAETGWTDGGPYRERFAQWATSGRNPWFATNAVNRLWAHFFAHGLVTPLDGFNGEEKPSHPELLALLSKELVEADFDLKHLIRCVCKSRAYQRSSRPVAGNERDETWFSHYRIKLMRPEELYDSVSAVLQPPGRKGGAKSGSIERAQVLPGVSRDEFIRYFASRADENSGSRVNLGVPQFLRLMNGPMLNAPEMVAARNSKSKGAPGGAIETAYLAAYSRPPSDEERRVVEQFLTTPTGGEPDSAGLLWTLLNSAEFVTNH